MKEIKHKHLIIRAEVSNPINDPISTELWLKELVTKIDMKLLDCITHNPVSGYCEEPGLRGITGVILIETSHIVIHIWDEPKPALVQLDVYSCADFDIAPVINHLDSMNPVLLSYKFLDREHDLVNIESGSMRAKLSNNNSLI